MDPMEQRNHRTVRSGRQQAFRTARSFRRNTDVAQQTNGDLHSRGRFSADECLSHSIRAECIQPAQQTKACSHAPTRRACYCARMGEQDRCGQTVQLYHSPRALSALRPSENAGLEGQESGADASSQECSSKRAHFADRNLEHRGQKRNLLSCDGHLSRPRGRPKCSATWNGKEWILDADAADRAAAKLVQHRKTMRERQCATRSLLKQAKPALFADKSQTKLL